MKKVAIVLVFILLSTSCMLNVLAENNSNSGRVIVNYYLDGVIFDQDHLTITNSKTVYPRSIPEYDCLSSEVYVTFDNKTGQCSPSIISFEYKKHSNEYDNLTPTPKPAPTPTKKTTPIVEVGSYISFGHYPQTAEGTDNTPIEWLVLDVQGSKALVISRYGLDTKPYYTSWKSVTWETCTLRTWLNNDFMNTAFSAAEQSAILTTTVDNSKSQGYSGWSTSGGNNTQDKLFLLSYAEANKYFGVTENAKNFKSRVSPTAYAIRQGAFTWGDSKTADGAAAGWWWLRSPGNDQSAAASLSVDGALEGFAGVLNDSGCVRPAFWLNLESSNLNSSDL